MSFPTSYAEVLKRVEAIDPIKYGRTRNFKNGAVTRLSPYISRGMITTKDVMNHALGQGHSFSSIETLIQELAWRDYWQQIWIAKGADIDEDLKHPQSDVTNHEIANALIEAKTGITAVDSGITQLYENGYMHNHMRMYVAAIACNMSKSHWKEPAKWMYYNLLDGDWASNALSWQWVAGSNSNKKYVANQENINKYFDSTQRGTFLDIPYSSFTSIQIPEILSETQKPWLNTVLPEPDELDIDQSIPTLVFNYYNLDPKWHEGENANRILLLEPTVFNKYPVSEKAMDFALALSQNIEGIQVFVGEFDELKSTLHGSSIHFKEHPLNRKYQGIEEPRDWMFGVTGYYRSFFGFWKKCKKEIKSW